MKKLILYIVALFFIFEVEALSYKPTTDSKASYKYYMIIRENDSLKVKLKKENFSEDASSLLLTLRRPSFSKSVATLQSFAQELVKLDLNEAQMNLALKVLYTDEVEKLSLNYFSNKYTNESYTVINLTHDEKETKKYEYKADLLLLKYIYLQTKDINSNINPEVQALLLKIDTLINEL